MFTNMKIGIKLGLAFSLILLMLIISTLVGSRALNELYGIANRGELMHLCQGGGVLCRTATASVSRKQSVTQQTAGNRGLVNTAEPDEIQFIRF